MQSGAQSQDPDSALMMRSRSPETRQSFPGICGKPLLRVSLLTAGVSLGLGHGAGRHGSPFLEGATTHKLPRMQVTHRQGNMPLKLKRACYSETGECQGALNASDRLCGPSRSTSPQAPPP